MIPPRQATLIAYKKTGKPGIKIEFPYNREDVDRVRTIPNRKYHSEVKYWSAPLSIDAVEMLKEWDFTMDSKLETFLQESKVHVDQADEIEIPGLKGILYPFQKKGVGFLEHKRGRALIADEMGLGKTIQALAFLQLHPELRPVVIVVPASLKLNWKREILAWMTNMGSIQILSGTTPHPISSDITIINYDILHAWIKELKALEPQVLIMDEVHYVKNNAAKRTKAIKKLGKFIPHVIGLSGTPIVNRPIEIYNAVNLIDPTVLPSYWDYAHTYCGAKHNGYGWDFSGATKTEELHTKLTNSVMIRRLKKDVLPDLPDKVYSFVPIELDNRPEYDFAEANFISFVRKRKGDQAAIRASNAEALAKIEGLKQLAVKGKLKHCIDWIQNFLESGEKLVVFVTHLNTVKTLIEEFKDIAVKMDGSVSIPKRQEIVDNFQTNNKIRLFIGLISVDGTPAGLGWTLTAASNVAHLELQWSPKIHDQASDRVHRIGQKNSVNIHYLLAHGTIEERIAKLIDRKRKVLDAVLDGKVTEVGSLLSELMNEYE